ncbi:MAG: N-6 DNA methylase, partial [Deltaproteobacteria bacterium]|nr:N-6 DNA methylase [Deltaproteobacteria bacterium]
LIGKYVYLHYLRDRDILSDRKFERWGLNSNDVFGRSASLDGLQTLLKRLDEWLNGQVFPVDFSRRGLLRNKHISRVAATFKGDEPNDTDNWQLHLDFKAYDFSYIPIEVLSIVYEQFLHEPEKKETTSRGRAAGAYYTPIPVVNLMLSELEERRPLKRGMRVFDPACGSGAFLVQAFRRLIEKEFPLSSQHPSPTDLRELLETHFFGIDTDEDACSVAKLSLILTLLDYVHPPDLETNGKPGRKPRLPDLNGNIHCGNFFETDDWHSSLKRKKMDWIVGNPPWKPLKSSNLREEDKPVLEWINTEKKSRPVGNHQMARAFAWRVAEYVSAEGEIALFLPAMTLFEEAAKGFRSEFFQEMMVHTVINFSNMRWIISGGRFTAPAAALFYQPRLSESEWDSNDEMIRTYSPFVANQEATRPNTTGKRDESWSIIVNASEIRDISLESVADGQGLPWKVAAWGSTLDLKLLRFLKKRFETLGDIEKKNLLIISEGSQLRDGDALHPTKGTEAIRELLGEYTLNIDSLKGMRDIFRFPESAFELNTKPLLRLRGGRAGIEVYRAPHVIVSAARNFAIYSEDYIIVPPRQIGIVSPTNDRDLLKALALFLSSDFAYYYEFFMSTELGVDRDRSTLKALRKIPTPIAHMPKRDLKKWANFYDTLAKATLEVYKNKNLWHDEDEASLIQGSVVATKLIQELNKLVYEALALRPKDQALVHDFVRVRCALNDGRLGTEAVHSPTKTEMRKYAISLQMELDDFIEGALPGRHDVQIVYDSDSGMICVTLVHNTKTKGLVSVSQANTPEAETLDKYRKQMRQQKSQWVYFNRNLRIYSDNQICVFKPMQQLHWTATQARIDAADILSESISRRKEV